MPLIGGSCVLPRTTPKNSTSQNVAAIVAAPAPRKISRRDNVFLLDDSAGGAFLLALNAAHVDARMISEAMTLMIRLLY